MDIQAIHEFIVSRVGTVKCLSCYNPDLIPKGEVLYCPKCRTEHREDGWTVRYPVNKIDTSDRKINWGSYQDYAQKDESDKPARVCETA